MDVTIIGTGNMARGIATRAVLGGHVVTLLGTDERKAKAKALKASAGKAPLLVSGVSGEGVAEVLRAAFAEVRARRGEAALEPDDGAHESGEWRP